MIGQATFRYSHAIGFFSLLGRGFNNPVDIVMGKGLMYVANRAGADTGVQLPYKKITMCATNDEYLGEFSTGGTGAGELMWPASIAMDGDGNIYVSDEALQRISIFDGDGQPIGQWGVQGSGDGEFERPAGLVFDGAGNLLVVDGLNNRVQTYTKDGRFLNAWGRGGGGDGELNMPWGIHIDGEGNVYVADWGNHRIQKFDPQGNHQSTLGTFGQGDGQLNGPAGVAVDEEGIVYVADWGNERLQILAPDGSFIAKFRGDAQPTAWSDEYFAANPDELEERQNADMEPELKLHPAAELRDESAVIEKLFWGPTSVRLDDEGRVYVVDSCRHRIQVYVKGG